MMNRYGLGGLYRPKNSTRWWIRYSQHGKQIRESSGSSSEAVARRLLKQRIGQIQNGTLTPREEKVSLTDLIAGLETTYQIAGRRSLASTRSVLKHVISYFGAEARAIDITAPRLREYIAARQTESAAPASIARELSHLRTAFRLAVADGRLTAAPHFPHVHVDNARKGFIEPADFRRFQAALPLYLRDPVGFLYLSGWRSHEMKSLTWRDVDFAAGQVRLDEANSKNGKSRILPLAGEVLEIMERRRAARRLDCLFVYHRDGHPIGDFRTAFKRAAKTVGLDGLKPHDLRRSFVRNAVRAGVHETIAMALTGHKTRAVFDRYNVHSAADLSAATAKLADYLTEQQQKPTKVTALNSSIGLAKKVS